MKNIRSLIAVVLASFKLCHCLMVTGDFNYGSKQNWVRKKWSLWSAHTTSKHNSRTWTMGLTPTRSIADNCTTGIRKSNIRRTSECFSGYLQTANRLPRWRCNSTTLLLNVSHLGARKPLHSRSFGDFLKLCNKKFSFWAGSSLSPSWNSGPCWTYKTEDEVNANNPTSAMI